MYVEQDCTVRSFTANGAAITPQYVIGYIGKGGALNNWHGDRIGSCRVISRWRIQSYISNFMYQIEATVDGKVYTGRSAGEGMIYKGKRKSANVR